MFNIPALAKTSVFEMQSCQVMPRSREGVQSLLLVHAQGPSLTTVEKVAHHGHFAHLRLCDKGQLRLAGHGVYCFA
jgi:hypothetical protein